MGKYKHHSGAIGGGVNLSKGKTPHDLLMKYMPIDDKASGLFKMKQPFEMGKMHRGPLDKHGKHNGPSKMDPMHNGIPGVQKDDFEQFKSPNEMRGPLNQEDPVKERIKPKMKKIEKKCPDGMAWDEARGDCFKSKKEESKMKMKMERKIETKKQKQ